MCIRDRRCEPPVGIEQGQIVGGFAHAQVLALADKVVDAVKMCIRDRMRLVGMALGAALTCFVFIEIIKTELIKEI